MARWLKAIAPTRKRSGTVSTKVCAALRAATSRDGTTSFASIDPDRSVTTTTVACSTGTAFVVCGLASARINAVTASAWSTTGT